jgi:hypothetical protein
MAIKRILPQSAAAEVGEKNKIQVRFLAQIKDANTVAELKKCLRILSRHVFNEKDGE